MNSVLGEILRTGETQTATGDDTIKIEPFSISSSEGQLLQTIVKGINPTTTLEIGLGYGVSALFICDALILCDATQHIVIDPYQHSGSGFYKSWDGIGIANLRRAGYGNIVRLIEEPSYRALPELERSGQRVDFAFIDGWHTFDFTLIDFFYIDRILKVGGIVAVDDTDWPAIRKVCRFVINNLSYSVVGKEGSDSKSLRRYLLSTYLLGYTPLLRHTPFNRLLRPEVIAPDESIGLGGSCIAFRKDADDSRRGHHFVDF
jgi:predicted O-methyltransferase YrrM